MKCPRNTCGFWFFGIGLDSFTEATLSITNEYSGHTWNWQLWHSKKIRLEISIGSKCQLCLFIEWYELGYLHLSILEFLISKVSWCQPWPEFLCPQMNFCPPLLYIGRVHSANGRLPSGQVNWLLTGFGCREALAGDKGGGEGKSRG